MTGVHLRGGGVSLVLEHREDGLPVLVYWGADLGELDVAPLIRAMSPGLLRASSPGLAPLRALPVPGDGFRGRPGLVGRFDGGAVWSPVFAASSMVATGPGTAVIEGTELDGGLTLRTEIELAGGGLLRLRHRLSNAGATPYELTELAVLLPLPTRTEELLDFTGRWIRERHPQRHPFPVGSWVRESRRGRTGHDASLLLAAGTPGFGNRHGEVWGIHLAWSGDHRSWAERTPDGRSVLGAGELLGPGEIRLEPGQHYETPWVCAAYSERGLDGVSDALHSWIRARRTHPQRPRPVTLNTWEAVYFDHRLDRLGPLAQAAAELGIERFVLDDGWFHGRRDDSTALGDWTTDARLWPDGLTPLIEQVHGLGMEFGLWVEPEMISPVSELYAAHPDWVLAAPGRLPPLERHQQVLDVANPAVAEYLLGSLDVLLREHGIDHLKWDHNRDLVAAGSAERPGVHEQTLAVYRLLAELRRRHPSVEIESCASGGARVDLGILAVTDRVWPSDTNDALERQAIVRWTQLLLPPELIGAHVGPSPAHTTGRVQSLAFRAGTAMFGHFGVECDLTALTAPELLSLGTAIAMHKRFRSLLHSGRVVNGDHEDPAARVHGVVSADRRAALFAYVQLSTSVLETSCLARLPGLHAEAAYAVEVLGKPVHTLGGEPAWWSAAEPLVLTGRVLGLVGVRVPMLMPENQVLLQVTAR